MIIDVLAELTLEDDHESDEIVNHGIGISWPLIKSSIKLYKVWRDFSISKLDSAPSKLHNLEYLQSIREVTE